MYYFGVKDFFSNELFYVEQKNNIVKEYMFSKMKTKSELVFFPLKCLPHQPLYFSWSFWK